jgi:hypothetical protein
MNLLCRLLPDFSAGVCERSIGTRLFSCQGRVDFSVVSACSGARYCRPDPPPLKWSDLNYVF